MGLDSIHPDGKEEGLSMRVLLLLGLQKYCNSLAGRTKVVLVRTPTAMPGKTPAHTKDDSCSLGKECESFEGRGGGGEEKERRAGGLDGGGNGYE